MSDKPVISEGGPAIEFDSAVLQQIRRHARGSMTAEICGVLIGDVTETITRVEACIAGEKATEAGTHVTFTQETWQHIYKVKDEKFAASSIVGWYHSHPGFGIFLSDYDLFIHKNFFAAPHQVAWVFDPHSDDEGCFGWAAGEVVPVKRICVRRDPDGLVTPQKSRISTDAAVRPTSSLFRGDTKNGKRYYFGVRNTTLLAIAVLLLIFGALSYRYSRKDKGSSTASRPQPRTLESPNPSVTTRHQD